jgi:transglutaminase-like putative cysteine protease
MRIRISHATTYHYEMPPTAVTQMLRLMPRSHDGQYVVNWRIDLSQDCLLHQHEDAFGNLTHSFTADGPFTQLSITVEGEIDTQETNGIITGVVERFPPAMFLRETPLTQPDSPLIELAKAVRSASKGDTLALLHALMREVHEAMTYDVDPTHTTTTAAEAFKLRRGVCQDLAHIFIAAARELGVPARYVGGHLFRADGAAVQEAGHAWAEAYIEQLGWVGFDPANKVCTTDAYVRVAMGLDYLGAAPIRGTRHGGGGETLTVAVQVEQASHQTQN